MGIWFLSQYSTAVVLPILAQCVKGQSLGQQKPVSVLDGKLQLYQSPKTILLLTLPEWPVPIRLAKYLQNCHFPIISGRQNKGRSYFVWKRLAEVRLCSVRAAHRLSLHVPPRAHVHLNSWSPTAVLFWESAEPLKTTVWLADTGP